MDPRFLQRLMAGNAPNPDMGALSNPVYSEQPLAQSTVAMTPGMPGAGMGVPPDLGGVPGMGGMGGMGGGGYDPMAMRGGMEMTPDVGREGLQYDFDIDGQQQSFSFDNALTPQGVDTFRLNQGLTPDYLHAEDRNVLPPFRRPMAVFDPVTGQNKVRTPKNPANSVQQPERYGPGFGADDTNEYWRAGENIPPTISSVFMGRF